MNLERAFELLEIDKNSSLTETRERYRDLADIWDPSRHSHNPRRHKMAQEKLKQVNAAYDSICAYLLQKEAADTGAEKEGASRGKFIVACPYCGTNNQVGAYDQAAVLLCGKCGKPLFGYADESQKDEPEKRASCGDDKCIGIIGHDGRCNVCGRTFEEAKEGSKYREALEQLERRETAKKQKRKHLYTSFWGPAPLRWPWHKG